LDTINAIFSICMMLLHAYDTYNWKANTISIPAQYQVVSIFEIALDIYFIIDFALNLYISENKLYFACRLSSCLEYISVLPSFFSQLGFYEGNKWIQVTRSLRFILVVKLDPIFSRRSSEISK
jgi:potassium large conductance calcium-activated channel subfamily M alpha protein 1